MPQPVFTPTLIKQLENKAQSYGIHPYDLMEKVGESAAQLIADICIQKKLPHHAYVFCGKGNNGGDAYATAYHLVQKGFRTTIFQIPFEPHESSLLMKQKNRFQSISQMIIEISSTTDIAFTQPGFIIDGILGTGFRGCCTGLIYETILKINASQMPVFALDIASGLDAEQGIIQNCCVQANWTLCCEGPKIGNFVGEGWNVSGHIYSLPLGLVNYLKEQPPYLLLERPDASCLLPFGSRSQNKYLAGHVLCLAGSKGMTGAAVLSAWAAIASGAGIVHLLHPRSISHELTGSPWEIVRVPYDTNTFKETLHALVHASSCIVGPGLSRSLSTMQLLDSFYTRLPQPCILDADALFWLSQKNTLALSLQKQIDLKQAVLTPHKGEMDRMLGISGKKRIDIAYLSACQDYTQRHLTTLILKGGPSWIFTPKYPIRIMPFGDRGMATAGSGDVLSGIIGALLSQKLTPINAAILGSCLHGISGQEAALKKTSWCMTASEIIHHLPAAFSQLANLENAYLK